jgi:hypothetical protein
MFTGVAYEGGAPQGKDLSSASKPRSRIDRLEEWIAAVERHEPGSADGPVMNVAQWGQTELQQVWIDVRSIVSLVLKPDVDFFFVEPEWRPPSLPPERTQTPRSNAQVPTRRMAQVLYSRPELAALRAMAFEVTAHGGENRLLKRGALLHMDIAMLAPSSETGSPGRARSGPHRTTLYMTDGRPLGLEDATDHWEMARGLLSKVTPNPSGDEIVRLWYLAAAAFMLNREQLDLWHFERALETFPNDDQVLLLSGRLHETLAGARIQAATQAAPKIANIDIGSSGAELRRAERLFRLAIESDESLTEARVRHGRVLGRLGRHREAIDELRLATPTIKDSRLLYYAALFLGAEAEALGSRNEAQQSYKRAASLYPEAQSPRLALSRMAALEGNRVAAFRAIQEVTTLPIDAEHREDPWWIYSVGQVREVDALLDQLQERFRTGDLR